MLSIIIPTLNEESHLLALLGSIKKQDFYDYEIIVADAGSEDKTLKIAEDYGCTKTRGGLPARGRNNGAKVAKGEVLLFLDADVVLPPHFLKKSVEEFERRKLGIAGFLIKPMNGKKIDSVIYYVFDIFVRCAQMLFCHAACAIMAKKSAHNLIGGFDETIKLAEDYCYAKSASKVSKYGYIRQPIFVSMRRYEKDGRLTYAKYALSVLYTNFFGPVKSDIFKYKFNHYKNETKIK